MTFRRVTSLEITVKDEKGDLVRESHGILARCCHSVQSLVSSSFLSKNIKMRVYRTIILLLFYMGVKHGRSH